MATKIILSSLLFSLYFLATIAENNANNSTTSTSFVQASCRATTYPTVCIQSLTRYAGSIKHNPRQLAHTALAVSLHSAWSTRVFIHKLTNFKGLKRREYQAIRDCLEEIADSVDQIGQSIREIKSMGQGPPGQDFFLHISNMQTWVSAALTDCTTCLDELSDTTYNRRIKHSVRSRVTNVAQITTNALALINHLVA
ncbi:pectinesterase inhibitor 11-like [Impatiens glandulifera]|uniref:pectinesterase inhibitor 11-like n=1 Tax=Impatiens glandulifera TaxID=253017 RepID=UPI001FB17A56|nr:pectinesterase inhibitor 11-like [Impatiens glandulifera]